MSRRGTISIYDYPEHLNPFREDDDKGDRFNTTGRRRSSFRANAWNLFTPTKGKEKTSDDMYSTSPSAASRFMTWTPKLLRKSRFRRSSPPAQEPESPFSGRFSFRSPNTRTSLPPSSRSSLPPSSRTSLPPSSRSSLPPSGPRSALPPHSNSRSAPPPARPTSPPTRPAPPNLRTSGRPADTLVHSERAAATRRALFPATETAGEQPTEEENKYIQQGAKPKKKRRAPPPPVPSPVPSPAKSTSDNRQGNSNESDASMSSSVTSGSAEEATPPAATPDLDAIAQEPEQPPADGGPEQRHDTTDSTSSEQVAAPENNLKDDVPENGSPENHSQDHVDHNQQQLEANGSDERQEPESCPVNGVIGNGHQVHDDKDFGKDDEKTDEGSGTQDATTKNGSPGYELQELRIVEEHEIIHRKDENVSSSNGVDGGSNSDVSDQREEHPATMQNGDEKFPAENDEMQNGDEPATEGKKSIPKLHPEPKPRTILTYTTKD